MQTRGVRRGWQWGYRDPPSHDELWLDELRTAVLSRVLRVSASRFAWGGERLAAVESDTADPGFAEEGASCAAAARDNASFWMTAVCVATPLCDAMVTSSELKGRMDLARAWASVEATAHCARLHGVAEDRRRGELARRSGASLCEHREEGGEGGESLGASSSWLCPWEDVAQLVASRAVELRAGRAVLRGKQVALAGTAAFHRRILKDILPWAVRASRACRSDERLLDLLGDALGVLRGWQARSVPQTPAKPLGAATRASPDEVMRAAPPCMALAVRRVRRGGRTLTYNERGPLSGFLRHMDVAADEVADFVALHSDPKDPTVRTDAKRVARRVDMGWGCAKLCGRDYGMCPMAEWRSDAQVLSDLEDLFLPGAVQAALDSHDRRKGPTACCRAIMLEAHAVEPSKANWRHAAPHHIAQSVWHPRLEAIAGAGGRAVRGECCGGGDISRFLKKTKKKG